ncbi:hypothetical protein K491DRAFT_780926 [Lophiostoma macrostomum CBS 122681]|uniref:Expansin-like EG45 domain-containing protein n=1 Tax=Lophiostoma macrostomum CBS 122681 TaxID=1314788 RepID=A0A6A6SY04_9PLEO|nr:hypothetical protein K491DRAFT_780926 [Lophiostoma macrostomum CBS 122681]
MLLPTFPLTLPTIALFFSAPSSQSRQLSPRQDTDNICGLASAPDGTKSDLTNDNNACTPFVAPINFFTLDDPSDGGKCAQCAFFENADCSGMELKVQVGADTFGNTILFTSRRCGDVVAGGFSS